MKIIEGVREEGDDSHFPSKKTLNELTGTSLKVVVFEGSPCN